MKNNRRNRKLRTIKLLNSVSGETKRYFKMLIKFKSVKVGILPYMFNHSDIEQIVATSKANLKSMGMPPR